MMKKVTATILCLLIVLAPGAALAETEGQKQVREAGLSVEWLDLGEAFDFASTYWLMPKDSEGFYAVGAASVEHSNSGDRLTEKFVFIDSAGKQAIPEVLSLCKSLS
ncbi:MAG: hypothetical protein FWH49_04370 [Clostridiales bacterium]|nr:hypothetical protein [Clostridiales bacterium]